MLCGQYLCKNVQHMPQLIETYYNAETHKTYSICTQIDKLSIWTTILVERRKGDDENNSIRPVFSGGFEGIAKTLEKLSNSSFDFKFSIDAIYPTTFSELNFDIIRSLQHYNNGVATHTKTYDFEKTRECTVTLSVSYKDDSFIMSNIIDLGNRSGESHTNDKSHAGDVLINIPYFSVDGNPTFEYGFIDMKFELVPSLSSKSNDILFKNVNEVNRLLFTQNMCFLRDYCFLQIPVLGKNDVHVKDTYTIFSRVDPMTNNTMKQKLQNDIRYGTYGVEPNNGVLSIRSVAFDQWFVRSRYGQYDDGISKYLDTIYIGYHNSISDESLIGFKHSFYKTYCSEQFFDFLKSQKKSQYPITPVLDRVTFFPPKNRPVAKFFSVRIRSDRSPKTTDMDIDNPTFIDIFMCWVVENRSIVLSNNASTDYIQLDSFKTEFSKLTFLKQVYFDLLLNRLLPFLCTKKEDGTMSLIETNVLFRLHVCESENLMQSKVIDYVSKGKYAIPPMVYIYGFKNANVDAGKYCLNVKKFVNCFCVADFDDAVSEITNRKPDLVPYISYGYENLISEGKSILNIAIQLARLCHASIHEIFYGGKMLWHLRAMEYIFNFGGQSKPCKLERQKNNWTKGLNTTPSNLENTLIYGCDKWKLVGAHVSDAETGWFVENKQITSGENNPQNNSAIQDHLAFLLDFDGYYNSIICEFGIGFLCHGGFLTQSHIFFDHDNYGKPILSIKETDSEYDTQMSYLQNIYMLKELGDHFKQILVRRRDIKHKISQRILDKNDSQVNAEYTALKLASNSFFGCCGKSDSPITSKFVSNYITSEGRKGILRAQEITKNIFRFRIGMSDTDGIILAAPTNFDISTLTENINSGFKNGFVKMVFEEKYESLFIKNKKTYFAVKNVLEWEDQKKRHIPTIMHILKNSCTRKNTMLFHDILMNIGFISRTDVIMWSTINKDFDANVKCKGLWTKNWNLIQHIILKTSILCHAKSASFKPSDIEMCTILEDNLYQFCHIFVNEFLTGKNPVIMALSIGMAKISPQKFVDGICGKIMEQNKDEKDTFYRHQCILSEKIYNENIMRIILNSYATDQDVVMTNVGHFYDDFSSKIAFGYNLSNYSDYVKNRRLITTKTVIVHTPLQLIQFILSSNLLVLSSDDQLDGKITKRNDEEKQFTIDCENTFFTNAFTPCLLKISSDTLNLYPVTKITIRNLQLSMEQRREPKLPDIPVDLSHVIHNLKSRNEREKNNSQIQRLLNEANLIDTTYDCYKRLKTKCTKIE